MADKIITINITDDDESVVAKVDKGQKNEVYSKEQIDEQVKDYSKKTEVYSKTESDNYGIKNIYKTQLSNVTNNDMNLEYRNGTGLWNNGALNVPYPYGTWVNFVSSGGNHNNSSNWINQFLFPAGGGDFYFRNKANSGAWSPTYKVITSKDYTSLSKIKENIEDYKESALELINKLNIVQYDRIDTKQKGIIGILADADTTNECFLSPTKDYIDVYQTLFVLAKAVQELSSDLENLKSVTTSD